MRRGILQKYAPTTTLTPSNEGFMDGLRFLFNIQKKEVKAKKEERFRWLDWVQTNIPNGKLSPSLKPVDGQFTIAKSNSGYFHRAGKPFRNSFEHEYDSDMNALHLVWKKLKPVADKYLGVVKQLERQISKLPYEVNEENVAKVNALLESYVGKYPITPADFFDQKWDDSDPAGWIGGFRKRMVYTDHKLETFNTEYELPTQASFDVVFKDSSDVQDAITMLQSLIKFSVEIEDVMEEWPIGLDATDPPIRGFCDYITDKGWDGFSPAGNHVVHSQATGMGYLFRNRVERLIEGLVIYLMAATERA